MSNLYFSFLGTPDVRFAGERIKFRSRKELALLVYLVVESGWYGRDHLIALLWPNSDRKQGRLVFRSTLSRLRKRLSIAGDVLLVEEDKVAFNGAVSVVSDLRLVQTAVSPQATVAYKKSALSAVRGSFLAGFSLADSPQFDDWIRIQTELWQQRLELLLEDLSRILLASRAHAEAVEVAAQWVATAPLNESAYQRLMQAQLLQNGRASALKIYEQCCAVLERELGIEPDAETQTLAQHIRQEVDIGVANLESAPTVAEPTLTPFVGRQQEVQQLITRFHKVKQGQSQLLIIAGDAGMGKTQLVQTFLNWVTLDSPQADILLGRAYEMGGHLPYQPITQALRERVDAENAPDDLLADVWLAELSQLLPELRDRYPDLPAPMRGEPDFVRARLFEAIATLGGALAESQPVILFVDDVQWADDGSRELIQFLCSRWQEMNVPILILLTVRQEAILGDETVRQWISTLAQASFGTQITLWPLVLEDIVRLTSEIAQNKSDLTLFSDWLYQETDGIPFFIAQFLQMLYADGYLSAQLVEGKIRYDLSGMLHHIEQDEGFPLPPSLRDLILSRLSQLDETSRQLLTTTAVFGQACTFEWLCEMSNIDEMAGLTALEQLLNYRLLLELKGKQLAPAKAWGSYAIAHDKIREVVYEEASEARRRITHRRVYTLLKSENSSAATIAFHAEAAQLTEPTFRYSLLAGNEAMQIWSSSQAEAHYRRALQLLDEVEATSDQRRELCLGYGRSLELLGNLTAALEHYEKMAQFAHNFEDNRLLLATIIAQATIRSTGNSFNNFALAETLSQQALELAYGQDDRAAEAKIRWILLNIYRWTGRNQEALTAGKQSIALAEALGLEEQAAYAANDLVSVYLLIGDTSQFCTYSEQAIASWRRLGDQSMLVDALAIYGLMQAVMGNYSDAQQYADEALTIARSLHNRWGEAYTLYTPIYIHLQKMNIEEGLAAAETSLRLAKEVGVAVALVIVNSLKSQLHLAGGDLVLAAAAAEEAVAVAKAQLPFLMPIAKGALALVRMAQDAFDEASVLLADVAVGEDSFTAMMFFVAETAVCQYHYHLQHDEQVVSLTKQLLTFLEREQLTSFVPQFAYFQARALIALQKPKSARKVIQQGLSALAATKTVYFANELHELTVLLEGGTEI